MPALSSKTPVAVRQQNRISTSPTRAPPNSMGSNNYNDRGGYREGAPVNSTRNSNNSMYNAMSAAWGKELQYEQKVSEEIQNVTKTKKVAQSPSPRPSTPHGKGKNFIERNKQYVQAVPTSPTRATAPVKKSKEDSQSVSPTPSSKPKSSVATQNRPLTPGASNGQSSVRSQAKTDKKTKATTTTNRRSVSPPASSAQSAHSRSHVHAATNSSHASTGHGSAHSRSHVRSATPEASLRDEIKKLKKLMMQYEDWLNDKESELLDSEDVIDALQERVAQVEARNREVQRENEFLRTQLKEQLEKQKSNEPTKLISSVMSNIQRIRGESAPPVSEPEPHSPTSSSPMSSKPSSPVPESPKPSPVLITSKMRELSKANNINNIAKVMNPSTSPPIMPRVVPKAIKVNSNVQTSTRPTAPSPAVMNSPFNNGGLKRTEMFDRQTAFDRKQAAALNVVMEESDDSEVDEFVFDREDTSDDQTDSSEPSEDETENNTSVDTENESHDDDDDFRWSTRASTKNDLDSIIEEDEESEFEYEPQQENRQQKNLTPVNPVAPLKNSFATVAQVASAGTASNNNISSPGRLRNFDGQSVYSSSQQLPKVNNSENFDSSVGYPHLDSMSSTKSDSSDDSIISASSSKNNSQSSVTSPSSADISPCDSLISQQNLVKSNGLYDQFISDSTSKSSSYNNGITGTGSNNKSDNPNFGLNSAFNKSVNDNSALNSNKHDINSTSVSKSSSSVKNLVNSKRSSNSVNSSRNDSNQSNSRSTTPTSARPTSPASSSRASTPSSNASTARAPSPASPSSSRASTPSSESSRNASSGHNRRSPRLNSTGNSSSFDKCPTDIPLPPSPPPPPPASKDPLATLQHYLRLISENSVMENPLKAYDIKKVIDEGSSAKVYNANPLSNPEEDCAIKIVPLTYSLEFIFNEIYVLKNLKHKNIVDFKESFLRWDGKTREVWIAMEKCARGDVTSRAGKVTQREVGRIAGELLSALKHLHHHGVIHRDIKLSNILVDAKNEVKLADFGISSLTPTSTTSMVGTIPYMAPDVVLVGPDRPYDTKADIWSLGVCILELLTGKAAWGRIRDDEIMDKLRKGEMPHGFQRLRKKNEIGWEAVDFLEKCFIKTPENRLSAEELLKHPFITGNHN